MERKTILEELEANWKVKKLSFNRGVKKRFNKAKIGRFSVYFPNVNETALLLHDINHLITDFPTSWKGEFQISAWEIASGGIKGFPLASFYPISLSFIGLFIYPREVLSAFKQGKKQQNAFLIHSREAIFQMTLEEIKRYSNKKDLVCGNRKADGEEI